MHAQLLGDGDVGAAGEGGEGGGGGDGGGGGGGEDIHPASTNSAIVPRSAKEYKFIYWGQIVETGEIVAIPYPLITNSQSRSTNQIKSRLIFSEQDRFTKSKSIIKTKIQKINNIIYIYIYISSIIIYHQKYID